MDPKFVNLLIQQLLNTTKCPKCGSTILPVNVKVEQIGNDECLFKMQCAKCKTIISADAHMKQNPTQNKKSISFKKTSQKPLLKVKEQTVNLDDLMQIKKILNNFSGNFNSLFQ